MRTVLFFLLGVSTSLFGFDPGSFEQMSRVYQQIRSQQRMEIQAGFLRERKLREGLREQKTPAPKPPMHSHEKPNSAEPSHHRPPAPNFSKPEYNRFRQMIDPSDGAPPPPPPEPMILQGGGS